jgi:vacuolar-type H+-ATPase subunit H
MIKSFSQYVEKGEHIKMLEDALKSVKSAESAAAQKLKDADLKAAEILKKANDDAVQMKKDTAASMRKKAADDLESFDAGAESRKADAAAKDEQEIKEMKAAAMTRAEEAADAIINALA